MSRWACTSEERSPRRCSGRSPPRSSGTCASLRPLRCAGRETGHIMTVETNVMRLDRLLAALPEAITTGGTDREVTTIAAHHDAVRPGAVFVAVRGFRHDGHTFAAEAASRGAAAVVLEREIPLPGAVTRVLVGDTRVALAHLSAAFFGFPSQSLDV